jgi:hypothetical protein
MRNSKVARYCRTLGPGSTLTLVTAVTLGLLASHALAGKVPKVAMPNLLGLWQASYAAPTTTGKVEREFSIEITRQDGELLWGVDIWHPLDKATGKPSAELLRSPVVGSVNPRGDGGMLVAERVRFQFRLVKPDEMELDLTSFATNGEMPPTAFYAVLKRGGVGAVTAPAKWPRLSAIWRGLCVNPQGDGPRPGDVRIDVVSQAGALIAADDVWSPKGPITQKTSTGDILRERLLGSLNPAGTGGILAKQGATYAFSLLSKDRMEVELIRVAEQHEAPTVLFSVLSSTAQEPLAPVQSKVSLVGTWKYSTRYPQPDAPAEETGKIVIKRQEGNAIWADDVWTGPESKGGAAVEHRDALLGSLSPDQTHGALAKQDACFTLRVVDANHMELGFWRVGAGPTAFYGTMTRQK